MFPTDRFLGRGEVLGHGASSLTAIPQRREQRERAKREEERSGEKRVPRSRVRSEGENPSGLLASHRLARSCAGHRPPDWSRGEIKFGISCSLPEASNPHRRERQKWPAYRCGLCGKEKHSRK